MRSVVSGSGRLATRTRDFFALDDEWSRPGRGIERRDAVLTGVSLLVSLLVLELMRGLGSLEPLEQTPWQQRLLVTVIALPLLVRRRWPLLTVVGASIGYWAIATYTPLMASLLSTQVCYFLVVLGAVAWARSRRDMAGVVGAVVALMFLWLAWGLAVGNVVQEYVRTEDIDGWHLPTAFSAVGMAFVINVLFFGGAVIGGQTLWRAARQRTRLQDQASTIARQSAELQERAVVEERLRIARELHDVVAHHVSGMGVQAGAARRVLHRSPEQAEQALVDIEDASRGAVTQMRDLLGTLRAMDGAAGGGERRGDAGAEEEVGEGAGSTVPRAPEPGLGGLADLVEARSRQGLEVSLEVVEERAGDLDRVPPAVGHSLYRTTQEALTNVTRHSTARRARVAVRVGSGRAEVEVTDDGRPRGASGGSGMGHLGIRERAASHHGTVEIGPRPMGGYRVRMRVPVRPVDGAGDGTADGAGAPSGRVGERV